MEVVALGELIGDRLLEKCVTRITREVSKFYKEANIQVASLNPETIKPLARFAVRARLDWAMHLISSMLDNRVEVYEPALIRAGGGLRLIFPPIVESQWAGTYLIDGTHRMLAARSRSVGRVKVVVISDRNLPPLPCEPTSWEEMVITEQQLSLEEVLTPLDRSLFRPATSFFNSTRFRFSSEAALIEYCNGLGQEGDQG